MHAYTAAIVITALKKENEIYKLNNSMKDIA